MDTVPASWTQKKLAGHSFSETDTEKASPTPFHLAGHVLALLTQFQLAAP